MDDDLNPQIVRQPYDSIHDSGLSYLLWAYPVLSLVLMAINLYFIVHALKNGRPYYWIWIIFMMPVLGAAAYFFVEMKPQMRRVNWKALQWQFASPQVRINTLQQAVNHSPTVKSRSNLARQYETCLSGVFTDDPRLQINLATAWLECNEITKAVALAEKIPPQRDPILEEDRKLVLYRSQASTGNSEAAIEGLATLAGRTSSLRPRYYLAKARFDAGNFAESTKELQAILQTFRNGNALLRKSEQQWYVQAKQLLKKKSADWQ
jgi:hypothetical protein